MIARSVLRHSGITLWILISILYWTVRIIFLWAVYDDPMFRMPIIDSLEFDIWAYRISQGQWLWDTLQNHTPLYAYFVAGIYLITGHSPLAVALTQFVLGYASLILIYQISERIFNKTTAIIAACTFSLYWYFIYLNTFIYSENLSIFLNLSLIAVLLFWERRKRTYVFAGLLLGLSIICRPEIALFGIFVFVWILRSHSNVKTALVNYIPFALGAVLIITPVVIQNYRISGEPLLRTQFGANVYMGNVAKFGGTNIDISIGKRWDEFITIPHRAYKRDVTESESNSYYLKETLNSILNHPGSWAKLIASKAVSVLSGREFFRTEDLYVYYSYLVYTPLKFLATPLLFALAWCGVAAAWRRREQALLLFLFLTADLFILFFPIKIRYLMPVFPVIIIFTSFGAAEIFKHIYRREWRQLTASGIILVLSFSGYIWNPVGIKKPDVSETYYAIAKNFVARDAGQKAFPYFLTALHMQPNNVSYLNDLAVLHMKQDRCDLALPLLNRATQLDPDAQHPRLNLERCRNILNKSEVEAGEK